jgi:hypothetical protein
MNTNDRSARSGYLSRKLHWLFLLFATLLLVLVALIAGFMAQGTSSKRFADIHEGMSMAQVNEVLNPSLFAQVVYSDAEGQRARHWVVRCNFSGDPMFPGFGAEITYVDGVLVKKTLQNPSSKDLLRHWWSKVWERK